MKLSARNQLKGTVSAVKKGAVNAEVAIGLSGGERIVAVITNAAVDSLGLREGMAAYAVIKASSVMIGKDLGQARLSTRNILQVTVRKVVEGAVDDEIHLGMGDRTLVAIITKESAHYLGLKEGEAAYALVKASNVMVGVE